MYKKTMTYTDFDGNERTEDFYFNLTEAEVMEMEMGTTGGMKRMLEKIVAEQDTKRIIETFKDIILRAYGEKSADGRRFVKNKEIADAFSQTEAYSQLFMQLATDADAAANFINNIVPQKFKERTAETGDVANLQVLQSNT